MQCDRPGSVLLDVRGMWCTSCANAVERMLRRQPGVLDAKVSFASESATLEWNPATTQLDAILAPVAKLGYECVPEGPGHDRRAHLAKVKRELSIRLAVVAVLLHVGHGGAMDALHRAQGEPGGTRTIRTRRIRRADCHSDRQLLRAAVFPRGLPYLARGRARHGLSRCHGRERIMPVCPRGAFSRVRRPSTSTPLQ